MGRSRDLRRRRYPVHFSMKSETRKRAKHLPLGIPLGRSSRITAEWRGWAFGWSDRGSAELSGGNIRVFGFISRLNTEYKRALLLVALLVSYHV